MIGKKLGPIKRPDISRVSNQDENSLQTLKAILYEQREMNRIIGSRYGIETKPRNDSNQKNMSEILEENPLDKTDPLMGSSFAQRFPKVNENDELELKKVNSQMIQDEKPQQKEQSNNSTVNKPSSEVQIISSQINKLTDRIDKFLSIFEKAGGMNVAAHQQSPLEIPHQTTHHQDSPLLNHNTPINIGQTLKQIKGTNDDKKKKYNVLSDIVNYTDRREFKIKIEFQQIAQDFPVIQNYDDLVHITTEWIGEVYRRVASVCWNMILNGYLNFDETKILFTENIIFNYIEYMAQLDRRGFSDSKLKLTEVIDLKAVEVLEFLGKQFPQTKIQSPNIRLREILPTLNNSKRIKYDLIQIANGKGFRLYHSKTGNYSQQVMKLINFMIDETNEEYNEFEKECITIFEQIYLLPSKRIKAEPKKGNEGEEREQPEEGEGGASKSNIVPQKQQQVADAAEDVLYKDKAKRYTKFLIGRKINKNVPKFSREEIQNGLFVPKSPSILRIITKWLQELMDIIKNPEKHILNAEQQQKSHAGNFVVLFSTVRKGLCNKILEKRGELFQKVKQIRKQCYLMQSQLCNKKFTQDSTQSHLSDEQIQVGKFSSYLQKANSSYMFQQLNAILHFLLQIPSHVDQKKLNITNEHHQHQARSDLDRINLVTMKIFDLLRCKCISNEEEIMWIVNYLKSRNNVGEFKLVRVKDRLSQGTRDINCNLRFKKGGFLSQMQLSVVSNIDKKQEMLDSYNHFIYELKRSKLGPLSENVAIWTVLEQRSLYFQNIAKKEIPEVMQNASQCCPANLQKFIRPICCESCGNFYPWPETCILNLQCTKCRKSFCGECYIKKKNDKEITELIFENMFKSTFLKVIRLYDSQQNKGHLPLKGIYIKKYRERKELNFFTMLIKRSDKDSELIPHVQTERIYKAFKEGNLTEYDSVIPVQITFVHTVARNDKIVEKQKNKTPLIGELRKGTLYLVKDNENFLNEYYLFQLRTDFQGSQWLKYSLKSLQEMLNQQQNYKMKVYNIIQEPVYVDTIQPLKKKSDKLRELNRFQHLFAQQKQFQQILAYKYKNVLILGKTYKTTQQIAVSINYTNNVAELKKYAIEERNIISLDKKNLSMEIENLKMEIQPNLFKMLQHSLHKIYLNYNNLTSIEGLKDFVYIEVLYLRHNKITSLKGLEDMKYLSVLRFDDNAVTDISALTNVTSLKRLMGIENKVTSIEALKKLKHLKTVEFEDNDIDSLEPIRNLKHLEEINFKNNTKITDIPELKTEDLESIQLSNTNIPLERLETFKKYTKVSQVVLDNLKLQKLPHFLTKLKLKQLWLQNNEIEDLSELQCQIHLKVASFKGNKIKKSKYFKKLSHIKVLYLDNNLLTELNGLKYCVDTLKYLSITNNPLDDCSALAYKEKGMELVYSLEGMTEKAKAQINDIMVAKAVSSSEED